MINENDKVEKEDELKDIKDRINYLNQIYSRAKDESMKTSIKKSMAKLAARRTMIMKKMNEALKVDGVENKDSKKSKETKNSITRPDEPACGIGMIESQPIEELSKSTMQSYAGKAFKTTLNPTDPKSEKRQKGLHKAIAKIANSKEKSDRPSGYVDGLAKNRGYGQGRYMGDSVEVDGETIQELSNDTLASYKKKSSADINKNDAAGNFKKSDKRYSGIVKATIKQLKNDVKKHTNENKEVSESTFVVTWSDLDYKVQSKQFKNEKTGSPDSAEKAAREFAKKLEKQNNIRTVKVRSIAEDTTDEAYSPGWMLKADPELAKKFKEKKDQEREKAKILGSAPKKVHGVENSGMVKVRGIAESEQVTEEKHRVAVTVSEPDHPAVSKRKEQIQKVVRLTADNESHAVEKAKAFYKKQGYKVHGASHAGMVKESSLDEGAIKKAEDALAKHAQTKIDHEKKYGPMNGADLHTHETIRKQLLAKKKRAQYSYTKKMNETHLEKGEKIKDGKEELTIEKPVGKDKYLVKAKEPK